MRLGRAWQLRIPVDSVLYGSASINNLLEFLGMAVNVWLECMESDAQDCILSIGDNTSAVGWLHKSSHFKLAAQEAHLMIARRMALLVLDANCCLASQHIQGDLNTVADLLSFSDEMTRAGGKKHPIAFDNPPNDVLLQRFHIMYYPEQIPKNFKISKLPSKILSWVLSVLRITALCSTAEQKAARSPTTGPRVVGSAFAPNLYVVMTLSSITYPQSDERSSFVPTLPAFE